MTNTLSGRPLVASEHFVELTAGRYRYLTWGRPENPPVLLLHGRTSLVETWDQVAAALADRWHVIALEQRGHGGSPWDAEGKYNLIDFLTDVEEFVDRVIGGPHALIGHSMGSCTALVYGGRHPERVTALVLEDGGPPGPTVTEAVAENRATAPASFATWQEGYAYIAAGHEHLGGAELDRRVDLTLRPGEGGRYYWRADVSALLSDRHWDDLMDRGQWEAVERLAVDTIFLWAADPYLVEPEVVDRMVEMNPRITKLSYPTGHSIHEERLDLFLADVVPFLEQHRDGAS